MACDDANALKMVRGYCKRSGKMMTSMKLSSLIIVISKEFHEKREPKWDSVKCGDALSIEIELKARPKVELQLKIQFSCGHLKLNTHTQTSEYVFIWLLSLGSWHLVADEKFYDFAIERLQLAR